MSKSDKEVTAKSKNDLRREHMEKQKAVKRRRKILAYCLIFIFLVAVFTILTFTVFLRISEINISGKTNYTTEEFIKASGLDIGDQLYLFNTEKAEEQIETSLPMVEEAEITRKISGKVTISVKTASPEYAMSYGEKFVLLSKNGKVLSLTDQSKIKGKTLIITGVALKDAKPGDTKLIFSDETEEKRETAETLETILTALKDSQLDDITEINIKKKNNITMNYQNRITLKFGGINKLENKIKLAVASLEEENNISYDQSGTLDLTINGKATFRPAEE